MDRAAMTEAVLGTIRANEMTDGYVRLVVTRGVGSLGLSPKSCPQPTVFIIAAGITLYPEEMYRHGLKLVTCATRRIAHGALSPMVKSLNYLNNIMAKIEAEQAGAGEGLMLNEQGYVAECTGDNIFVIKDGRITTPPISAGALAGVTREVVFEMAEEAGIPIREQDITRYDIYTADECFLTGTAAELIPAVELDSRLIHDGKPGPITAKLNYTSDHAAINAREWQSVPATVADGKITAELPTKEVTVWFLTITDERNATVSSEVFFK